MKLNFNSQHYSFKERGARNALLSLTDEQKKNGVVSASMGNHSQVSIPSYLNFYKLFNSLCLIFLGPFLSWLEIKYTRDSGNA